MSELPPLNISNLPPLHPPEHGVGEDTQENATAFITEEFIDEWENLLFKKANADVLVLVSSRTALLSNPGTHMSVSVPMWQHIQRRGSVCGTTSKPTIHLRCSRH